MNKPMYEIMMILTIMENGSDEFDVGFIQITPSFCVSENSLS